VTVLKAIWAVAGGVAAGLAAAVRAVTAAFELGRDPDAPPEQPPDPEAAQRLRASFPSQRASAAMLDPYVSHADAIRRGMAYLEPFADRS
jgi:hypothetical protein